MGLDQLQMAPLVLDNSLLRLFTTQGKLFDVPHETFFIRNKWRHLALCLRLIQPNYIPILVYFVSFMGCKITNYVIVD